jgi:carboxypeptidase family protein
MKRSMEPMIFLMVFLLPSVGPFPPQLFAGQCRVQISMINHNRYAYQTDEECNWLHTEPWGNWGVSSNVGSKQDGDQFQGWYRQWGHLQWNSCSKDYVHPDQDCRRLNFPAPGIPYPANGYPFSDSYPWNDSVPPFGTASCVDQYSPYGYNVYGGAKLSYPVPDAVDSNCDGIADAGGCLALNGKTLTIQNNFMSVYELDSPDADDLVQTLYFPQVSVALSCNVDACWAVGDTNHDGWLDDIGNRSSPAYKWPSTYQNDVGRISYPTDPGVPAKRIDSTIRIGYVFGTYDGAAPLVTDNPTITRGISLSPASSYQVGQTVTAQFSLAKHGCPGITFNLLTLGGRDPNGAVADFTYQPNIVLKANASYNYQGSLTLKKVGTYHFFVAYRTPDGLWHSNVPTEGGARSTLDIAVSAAPAGTISATPATCTLPAGSSACTSTIKWSTQNAAAAGVWVQDVGVGGSASPFAGGTSGSSNAPWIQGSPHRYVFTLYNTSSGSRVQLAQVTVTGSSAAAAGTGISIPSPDQTGKNIIAQLSITNHRNTALTASYAKKEGLLNQLSAYFALLLLGFGYLWLRFRAKAPCSGRAQSGARDYSAAAIKMGATGRTPSMQVFMRTLLLTALCILALAGQTYGVSRIFGKVLDGDTGIPLAAEIGIAGSDKGNIFLRHVQASEQGEFEINALAAGDSYLTTKLEGYAAEHLSLSLNEEESRYVEFSLHKGKTVRGVIHDSAGNPLPGASVSVAYAQEGSHHASLTATYEWERGEVRTGALGNFEIRNIHPEKQFVLEASHPDFLSAVSTPRQIPPGESAILLRLSLTKGIRLIGEIKDEDGIVVQDAQVTLVEAERRPELSKSTSFQPPRMSKLYMMSGVSGTFGFNQVKQVEMLVTVTHPGYAPFRQTIDLTGHQGPFSIGVVLKSKE